MDTLAGVEGAIEAAGHFLLFEQDRFARFEVVFVDGTRCDERLIAVAELCRFPDAVDAGRGAVGGLGKGDFAGGIGRGALVLELPEAQAGQSVFAFAGDEEAGKEIDIFKHYGVAVGNLLDPVFARGSIDWRGDEAEVAAAIVGADVPLAVAVIDVVLVLVLAGTDDFEFAGGLIGGKDKALGSGVAAGFEDHEFAVAGAACADVKAFVVVLIDEDIFAVGRVERVAKKLELALLFLVFDGIEKCGVVGSPGDGTDPVNFTREGFAGFEVLDVERVLAEAGDVSGVGEPAAVVGDVGGADGEECLAFGELVAVEDDLFRRIREELSVVVSHPRQRWNCCLGWGTRCQGWGTQQSALAAEDGVLLAFFGADVIPPVAFAVGGGLVSLLDVTEHLVVEVVAKRSQVGGDGFGIFVFRLEVVGDFGIVLVAQPGVGVGEGDAVEGGFFVVFAGDGWGEKYAVGHVNFKCSEGQGLGNRD